MCGIFGCSLSKGSAATIIHEGLKKLEYRGYDSAGLATMYGGKLQIKKGKGKIEDLHKLLNFDDLPGLMGIGHTRWATHGAPSNQNAHPHTDCHKLVALVHNGIVENFHQLKEELEARGHFFNSKTDTELICHLIEEGIEEGLSLKEAVRKAIPKLLGSFAIAIISPLEPNKIICVRKERPLVIGVGKDGTYLSSDIPALLWLTNKVAFLQDGDLAELSPHGYIVENVDSGKPVYRELETIDWTPEQAERGGFPHFMLKEIYEQPQTLKNALKVPRVYLEKMCDVIENSSRIFLIACGTSYHACLAGSYMLPRLATIDARPFIASEFNEWCGRLMDHETAVLALSQSGETADTLGAIRKSLEKGVKVLSITNVMGSTITRLSHVYVGMQAGPEIGVAATKTFTSQVAILAQLSLMLGLRRGTLDAGEFKELQRMLYDIPRSVEECIKSVEKLVKFIALRYAYANSFYFLSRGINVATALEGALKLKEISYIHAEGYPAGESKHGPIALIEKGFPCVFIVSRGEVHGRLIGNIMEMRARGARIISIAEEDDKEVEALSHDFIGIPSKQSEILSPLTFVPPLQLLAYYAAAARGNDPDKPRNLAKSVTVP